MYFRIYIFDDGNEKYQEYENQWEIVSRWEGKVKLKNIDGNTIIPSISNWKILKIYIEDNYSNPQNPNNSQAHSP